MNEYAKYLAEIIPEKDSLKLVKSEAEKYYKSREYENFSVNKYYTTLQLLD